MGDYAPVFVEQKGEPGGIGATKKLYASCDEEGAPISPAIMVDAGTRIENHPDGTKTTHPPDDDNLDVDVIANTHSHMDHVCRVPRETRRHRNAKYITSRLEDEASAVMLDDAFEINSRQWEESYKAGSPAPPVIFTKDELEAFHNCKKTLVDGPEWFFRPASGWQIGLHPANHTRGAQSIFMVTPDGRPIIDTGDTCNLNLRNPDKGLLAPDKAFLAKKDFMDRMRQPGSILVTEGTNAARLQKTSRELTEQAIIRDVREAKALGGITLFPAFINQRIPLLVQILTAARIRVHVDGKARELVRIQVPNLQELMRQGLVIFIENEKHEANAHREALLNGSDPCGDETPVILTGSANIDQGMSVYYGLDILPGKPNQVNHNKVIITGHLFQGSNAEALVHKIKKGETITLNHNRREHIVNVRCEVKHYDLSAHIYQDGLVQLLDYYRPDNVLVHHCPSPEDYASFVRAAQTALAPYFGDWQPKFEHLTYQRRIVL